MNDVSFDFCIEICSMLSESDLKTLVLEEATNWKHACESYNDRCLQLSISIGPTEGGEGSWSFQVELLNADSDDEEPPCGLEELSKTNFRYVKFEQVILEPLSSLHDESVHEISTKNVFHKLLPCVMRSLSNNANFILRRCWSAEEESVIGRIMEQLRNSTVFSNLQIYYNGEASENFLAAQLNFGRVDEVELTGPWNESPSVHAFLESFIQMPHFYRLAMAPGCKVETDKLFYTFFQRWFENNQANSGGRELSGPCSVTMKHFENLSKEFVERRNNLKCTWKRGELTLTCEINNGWLHAKVQECRFSRH